MKRIYISIIILALCIIYLKINGDNKNNSLTFAYEYIASVDKVLMQYNADEEMLPNGLYDIVEGNIIYNDVDYKIKSSLLPTKGKICVVNSKVDKYSININNEYITNDIKTSSLEDIECTDLKLDYKEYKIGDEVIIDNITWYVIDNSDINNMNLKLIRSPNIDNKEHVFDNSRNNSMNTYCKDLDGCNIYSKIDGIYKYYNREGTITEDSMIKKEIDAYKDSLNIGQYISEIRLLNEKDLDILECNKSRCNDEWLYGNYWLDVKDELDITVMTSNGKLESKNPSLTSDIRPVLIVHKSLFE